MQGNMTWQQPVERHKLWRVHSDVMRLRNIAQTLWAGHKTTACLGVGRRASFLGSWRVILNRVGFALVYHILNRIDAAKSGGYTSGQPRSSASECGRE
ncbi:MAG: hypothetical protein OHK0022_02670 [Roseiflexaceae bacterium]